MKSLQSQLPTQQWIEDRKAYIGGSDVAAILGKSSYATPLQVWMRKKGILPSIESTPIMEFGHYFEPALAGHFEEATGLKTRKINSPYKHHTHPCLQANIDRMVLAGEGLNSTAVLELKTTTSHRLKALDGKTPIDWHYQIQHYLGITGYRKAFLQIYERDTCRFHDPITIERDDNLIISTMNRLIGWWEKHIIQGICPDPINGEDVLILYPESKYGSSIEVTPSTYAIYTELLQVLDRKQEISHMEEYLKTKLKEQLGNAESLRLAGKELVSWKTQSINRFDTSAFKQARPKLYKKYIKQTSTRRFVVK